MFPAVFALLMLVGPFMNKGSDRADSASASFSLPPDHLPPLFICSFVFLYFFVLLIFYCCISVLFRLCIFSCPGISASSNVLWTKAATTALRHLHIEISCPSMFVLSDVCIVEFVIVVFLYCHLHIEISCHQLHICSFGRHSRSDGKHKCITRHNFNRELCVRGGAQQSRTSKKKVSRLVDE